MLDAIIVWLALNIYFEARNQPVEGQIAVSQVVMSRVNDDRYPNDVCEVIKQGPTSKRGLPILRQCQFSWWCDGKRDEPTDHDAYHWATFIAMELLAGRYDDYVDGATHYHADHVDPEWAIMKTKTTKIGNHIFWRWERST